MYTLWRTLSDGVHGGDDYSDQVWRCALSFSSVFVFAITSISFSFSFCVFCLSPCSSGVLFSQRM